MEVDDGFGIVVGIPIVALVSAVFGRIIVVVMICAIHLFDESNGWMNPRPFGTESG